MTIEINQPELEALIQRRLGTGEFGNVEELLTTALTRLPEDSEKRQPSVVRPKQNFAQFLRESPLRGSGLTLERVKDYPRPVEL